MNVDADQVSGGDLASLFSAVDSDKSGEINASEFIEWVWSSKGVQGRAKGYTKKLRKIKACFLAASSEIAEGVGWGEIFRKCVLPLLHPY